MLNPLTSPTFLFIPIVLTYFTGIMIQTDYFDHDDHNVGSVVVSFALMLIIGAMALTWGDASEQVGNERRIGNLHVELNKKQMQHKKVGGR